MKGVSDAPGEKGESDDGREGERDKKCKTTAIRRSEIDLAVTEWKNGREDEGR